MPNEIRKQEITAETGITHDANDQSLSDDELNAVTGGTHAPSASATDGGCIIGD